MKIAAAAILVALFGQMGHAQEAPAGTTVVVCMERLGDSSDISRAQLEASRMFAEISVRVVWVERRACSGDAIHIHLLDKTPENFMPGALAFARPDTGTYIEVFYDRIMKAERSSARWRVLAYVLVHELTHILQGIPRHSQSGIMKALWVGEDYTAMHAGKLAWAPVDVQLIQLGLQSRLRRRMIADGNIAGGNIIGGEGANPR
jgi:hypothetical protein